MKFNELTVNSSRLWESLMEMAEIGKAPENGVSRPALSKEDGKARDLLTESIKPFVDEMMVDEVGNMFFIKQGTNSDLPIVLSGSHLDTQLHGGRFDGVLGVLAVLEVLRTLHENQILLDHGLGLVNWSNEEEARFCPAMGSAVFSGKLSSEQVLDCRASDGSHYGTCLKQIGYAGNQLPSSLKVKAYLELHIEQGPVLENESLDIGVVTGAQGQMTMDVTLQGVAGHAGTVPMRLRADALACASEIISQCRSILLKKEDGVMTVGTMDVEPNSRSTIPSKVVFGMDIRNPHSESLEQLKNQFTEAISSISQKHNCTNNLEIRSFKPPTEFDDSCIEVIESAAKKLQYGYKRMPSGAFHDACMVNEIIPTGMIFTPCLNGISHHPSEYASQEQLFKGANTLLHSLSELCRK